MTKSIALTSSLKHFTVFFMGFIAYFYALYKNSGNTLQFFRKLTNMKPNNIHILT